MMCAECLKDIGGTDYFMVAVEIPYSNVFFHKECYNKLLGEVVDWDGLRVYLAENFETWYNIEEKHGKTRKNRTKTGRN